MELESAIEAETPEVIKVERALEALGFFTPSSKPLWEDEKVISYRRRIDGEVQEVKIQILPSAKYGLPNTTHQDLYRGFQAILADRIKTCGYVPNPIGFTTAELLAKLGRKRAGGVRYRQVEEWFDVMSATLIKVSCGVWNAKKKHWITNRVKVFDRVVSKGERLDDGTLASEHSVWLSDWQLDNLDAGYLFSLDFAVYKQLRNKIAKTLFSLLHCWFYAGRGRYTLKYVELCQWLGLTVHSRRSHAMRQLDRSNKELKEAGFLSRWEYRGKGDSFSITWHAGPMYLRQLSLPLRPGTKKDVEGPAHKLVRHFHERFKRTISGTIHEIEAAKQLIGEYGQEGAFAIVDFAVNRAKGTNFAMRNFGAIKQYVEEAAANYHERLNQVKEQEQEQKRLEGTRREQTERVLRWFHKRLGRKNWQPNDEEIEAAMKYSEEMVKRLAEDLRECGHDLKRFVEPGVTEALDHVVGALYSK